MRRMIRRAALLSAALSVALVSAACGSSSGSGTQGSGNSSSHLAAYLKTLSTRLAQYESVPRFVGPDGPSFNAAKLRGDTVLSIPLSDAIPFCVSLEQAQAQAAKLVGIKYISYSNQGNPSQWVAGFNEAISRHVNAILLSCAPNPAQLQPQIAAAEKAGIPVIASPAAESPQCFTNSAFKAPAYSELSNCFTTNLGIIKGSMAGVAANVDGPYPQEATLMADWAIVQTKGKLNALVITSKDIYTADSIVGAFSDEFKRWCPSTCKMTVINVPSTDWATELQTSTQSALLKDPSINYIMPIYDSMNEYVIPAITGSGRTDLHTVSYNGTPFVLKDMQQGSTIAADFGESLNWKGYLAMDQVMRVLTHTPIAKASDSPLRLWTQGNVSQAGSPPTIYDGYGTSYIAGFKKLWELK